MSFRTGRGLSGLPSLLALAVLAIPAPATAQYFGRQKVQYDQFEWNVMETPHYDIHFYPSEKVHTIDAARMAERWYARHSATFQHEFTKKPLILYANHPDFQQTNIVGGLIGESTGGVTEGLRDRATLPFTGIYKDDDHVLGHELVHVFQYDITASPTGGGLNGMSRLPLWLVEGMAEYLSLGRNDPLTAMWLRDAALTGRLPSIEQLSDPRYFPYRYGQALMAYIGGRWGDRAVTELFRFAARTDVTTAMQRVLGVSPEELSQDWIAAVRSTYLPLIEGRQRPEDAGDPILYDDDVGAMNLSPSVSPNGQYVAFYGRRELFTIDLYVADARTGKVLKKLTSPNRNDHFDALSFINSAGTWSPDGKKFAFIVFEEGDNRLAILDVASESIERKIAVTDVPALQMPAWSPDGKSIVFSGLTGGISDLYVLDLASGQVRQLTNDRYADLEPAWSPDGKTIAFVTDRGQGTDFDKLTYSPMSLALYDTSTGRIRVLNIFDGAKHINPQYSPDGKDLFFISDRDGFNDIYRLSLEDNQVYQVTRLATGVSGITALSPAMSVSSQTGRMLFSVFENSGNNIYGIDADRTRGEPVRTAEGAGLAVAGIVPPVDETGVVVAYLNDPTTGLPEEQDFPVHPYKPSISLAYLGPPSFGVGVSQFGTGVAGGASAFFSDMLNNHLLGVAIQAQGTLKDIGGQAIYQNAAHRWNWGGGIAHIPYLTGFTYFDNPQNPGAAASFNQLLRRIYIDQAQLSVMYPFSTTQRFELSGGLTRYSFDTEIFRFDVNQFGQQVTQLEKVDTTSPDPINFVEASAALVGDNSYMGFTSPIVGQRYRFQVTPTFGTIQYETVLADYRRYFFAKPFTLAFRAMHYGRYGRDAAGIKDGQRVLSPLFLGWETFIRGYSSESFDVEKECKSDPQSGSTCPAFDRLLGSRIALGSIEFRIPLIGTEQFGLLNFPFLPTEIAPFVDGGIAWGDASTGGGGCNIGGTAQPCNNANGEAVFSAGLSARFNILGYLVLEAYYAYPFQRPERGAHFGFQLAPGW